MIEGILFAMRQRKEVLEKTVGNKFEKIVISGGGSQSDEIMQITADILGMKIYRSKVYEASSLGAAIASAVGIRIYPNFESAVKGMVKVGTEFEPNESNKLLYNQIYESIFKNLLDDLQPTYKKLKVCLINSNTN